MTVVDRWLARISELEAELVELQSAVKLYREYAAKTGEPVSQELAGATVAVAASSVLAAAGGRAMHYKDVHAAAKQHGSKHDLDSFRRTLGKDTDEFERVSEGTYRLKKQS